MKDDALRPKSKRPPRRSQASDITPHATPFWAHLNEEDLLQTRISDLKLSLHETPLAHTESELHSLLASKNLQIRPPLYLADEWFSPEGVVAIAVPFYLAHPRLMALEQKIMLDVEGGTPESLRKLVFHETGHCFDHAFHVSKRKKWRQLFGSPDQDYTPETYRPRPYSRAYVKHLENWYAQAHPDEDFAETFAVWLDPQSDWRRRYADWPLALKKLLYVEELAAEFALKEPTPNSLISTQKPFSATRMRSTLARYYTRRRRENAEEYPDFYDSDLKRLFVERADRGPQGLSAERFMRSHRKAILESVSHWTGERKFTADHLLRKLSARCAALHLHVGEHPTRTALEISSYLTALVSNYRFTGHFKRRA